MYVRTYVQAYTFEVTFDFIKEYKATDYARLTS